MESLALQNIFEHHSQKKPVYPHAILRYLINLLTASWKEAIWSYQISINSGLSCCYCTRNKAALLHIYSLLVPGSSQWPPEEVF